MQIEKTGRGLLIIDPKAEARRVKALSKLGVAAAARPGPLSDLQAQLDASERENRHLRE